MASKGFDRISSVYDVLVRLVFGKSIVRAQRKFLNRIEDSSTVLILGGGTGRIVVDLLKTKPSCKVWYIDVSSKMIERSKNKIKNSEQVHFICGTENNIPPEIKFDAVITNFYLDMFSDHSLKVVVNKITISLKQNARWIATDFVDEKKWWQQLMIGIMYTFFRVVCGIEAKQLPKWNSIICESGFNEIESCSSHKGFIKSILYKN